MPSNIWDILITKQNKTKQVKTKQNNTSVLYFYFLILETLDIHSISEGEKRGQWVEWNEKGKVEIGEKKHLGLEQAGLVATVRTLAFTPRLDTIERSVWRGAMTS